MWKYIFSLALIFLMGCSSSDEGPVYRIGVDPSWSPQNFMGREAAIRGFSGELLQIIGNKENFQPELLDTGPEFLEWGLKEGSLDAILTSLAPSLNYEGIYLFSEPYLRIGPVLVVPINSSIKDLGDLNGKTIAVQRGSSAMGIIGTKVPRIVMMSYDRPGLVLENLLLGAYEAVTMPVLIAESYVHDIYKGQLKIVGMPLTEEALCLVTLADNEMLIEDFNKGLQEIEKSGQYETLIRHWRIY